MLGKLAHRHGYGKPIPRDALVRLASIPRHEEGDAKKAFSDLRKMPFIIDCGPHGVKTDNSEFGKIIQYLFDNCDWTELGLRARFHHFEGWDDLDLSS